VQFDSFSAALEMGGHGGYVWAVAVVTLFVVVYLLVAPILRSRRFMQEQRGVLRRAQREVSSASGS
jgi:heme exporter protein D